MKVFFVISFCLTFWSSYAAPSTSGENGGLDEVLTSVRYRTLRLGGKKENKQKNIGRLRKKDYLRNWQDSLSTRVPTSPMPTLGPSASPSQLPTTMPPTNPPTVPPTSNPTSHPSMDPSQVPSDVPSHSLAPTDACDAPVENFEVSVLIEVDSAPGLIQPADLVALEIALMEAYNSVARCDRPGAFINVANVTIDINAVDSFGDNLGTGDTATFPFVWKVIFTGSCRGCPTEKTLFDTNSGDSGLCACAFPVIEAYVEECNEAIAEGNLLPSVEGSRGAILDASPLLRASSGGNGLRPISTFTSSITISGSFGGSNGGSNGGDFDAQLYGQVFLETYNSLNALNSSTCDPGARTITSVVPTISTSGTRRQLQLPFSIVFTVTGTCEGCGVATVVFGEHTPTELDDTALCPAGAVLRCPSEEEFAEAFQKAMDRQEEGIFDIIDSVVQEPVELAVDYSSYRLVAEFFGPDRFGVAVAVSGDGKTVASSTTRGDYARVYRYIDTNSSWVQLGEDISALSNSGVALSQDGDTMVVGLGDKAVVLSYVNSSGEWSQVGSDLPGQDGDLLFGLGRYGYRVVATPDSTTIAISSGNTTNGYVRVFSFVESINDWRQIGNDITGNVISLFLTADGNTLVAGGDFDTRAAVLFVFNETVEDWDETQRFASSTRPTYGLYISISGNGERLVISDYLIGQSGEVWILHWDPESGVWNQAYRKTGRRYDEFGRPVIMSTDGRVVLAGADECYSCGNTGRVELFGATKAGAWSFRNLFRGPGRTRDTGFSYANAASSDGATLVLGSNLRGSIRIYMANKIPI